jgi:hypothetical protein
MKVELLMRITSSLLVALVMSAGALVAQEKPVPKDSMRVTVPGCSKGSVFTAAPRTEDQVGRADIAEGTRLRMNAPKKLMADIKAHEGQMIQITGLMKKGQYNQTGIPVGGGVRVTPGIGGGGVGVGAGRPSPTVGGVNYIDVESWQPAPGDCPSR